MPYDPETYWPDRHKREGEAYVARGGRQESHDRQLEALTPYLDHLPDEGRVLDFGCGPGRFRPALEARGMEYEGVDLIPELGTMEFDDIEPESFDAAVAIFVLQHIVDGREYHLAAQTLREALKPGGKLLVVDHIDQGGLGAHMLPRGARALGDAGRFADFRWLGDFDGHWVGVFTK